MQKTSSKSFNVVVTSNFKKEAKSLSEKYPSIKTDLFQLIEKLEQNPQSGTPLGKDCFKIRMAITSKGKVEEAELLHALRLLHQLFFYYQYTTKE